MERIKVNQILYILSLLSTIVLPTLAGMFSKINYSNWLILGCLLIAAISLLYQLYTFIYTIKQARWIISLIILIGILISAMLGFFMFCIQLMADVAHTSPVPY